MDATTERTIKMFGTAEKELGRVLKSLPELKDLEDEACYITGAIARIRDLCWAFRTFPRFDTSCLSRMKKESFVDLESENNPNEVKFTGDLFVPVFASAPYPGGPVSWDLSEHLCQLGVYTQQNLINENNQTLREKVQSSRGYTYFRLQADPPTIPADVARRVARVSHRFNHVHHVWEAEWKPAPIADPFIVGEIHGYYFLIDQFDLTKMERYIVSEFCQGKRE